MMKTSLAVALRLGLLSQGSRNRWACNIALGKEMESQLLESKQCATEGNTKAISSMDHGISSLEQEKTDFPHVLLSPASQSFRSLKAQ